MSRLVNGAIIVALAGAMLVTIAASPASAATTTSFQAVPGTGGFNDVACSTPTTCYAVGNGPNFTGGVFVPITDGVAGPAQSVPGGINGIACASATTCIAVSGGQVVVITNGVPGTVQQVPGGAFLTEIACSSPTTCVAVGSNQVVLITNGVPGPAQTVEGLTVDDRLEDVACSSATTCYAVGQDMRDFPDPSAGVVVPITNGIPGAFQAVAGSESLFGIDCASATTCYAAGGGDFFAGFFGSVVVPIVDGIPGALQSLPFPGPFPVTGVACASPTTCVVVGFSETGSVVPIINGIPGPEETVPVGGFYGVDCASATTCYAVGISANPPPYFGVVATITLTASETSLTCTPGTSASGAAQDVCKVTDPDGLRSIVVKNTATNQVQTSVGYQCTKAPKSTRFRVPAGTGYKVVVTDCHSPGTRTTFVINADGSVSPG